MGKWQPTTLAATGLTAAWLARGLASPSLPDPGPPAADQLDAAGYDFRRLNAILLTHAHWDHMSGMPDLSGARPALPPRP